jgi:hypothetical protein
MNTSNHARPPVPGPACKAFIPLLPLVAQQGLDPRDTRRLRQHLASCDYCQSELDSYNSLDDALARHFGPAPRGPLSPADISAITSRAYRPRTPPPEPLLAPAEISDQPAPRPPAPFRPMPRQPSRRGRLISLLSAAAAVLLIAAISLALFASHPGSNSSAIESRYIPQRGDMLTGLFMLSASEGWAVGSESISNTTTQDLILHYAHGQWNRVSSPTNKDLGVQNAWLTQVVMVSASEGWAIGTLSTNPSTNPEGSIFHYSAGRWTLQKSFEDSVFTSISMLSSRDGWISGGTLAQYTNSEHSLLLRYNGQTWAEQQAPGIQLTSISMTSASDGWAVGKDIGTNGTPLGVVLHYNGSAWTRATIPVLDTVDLISTVSANDVWAVGTKYLSNGSSNALARSSGTPWENIFAHYNGKTWTAVETPIIFNPNAGISALFMDAPSDGWAVGYDDARGTSSTGTLSSLYLHYSSGQWTQVNGPANPGLNAIFLTSPAEGWAVGNNGTIAHYRNSAWTILPVASSPKPTSTPASATPTQTPCYSLATPPPGPPLGGTPTPIAPAGWSTYTNTKYHYTINYPANWGVDNLQCPDADSLTIRNFYTQQWGIHGYPPGGIEIELSAGDNSSQTSALAALQSEERGDQSVALPHCTTFTTRALTISGHDAAEGNCIVEGFILVYIADGTTMFRIIDDVAPNGQPQSIFTQIINSITFTN